MTVWQWILNNKEWIAGILAVIFSFFTGKKLQEETEISEELKNLKTIREMEKDLINDMKKSCEEYKILLKISNDFILKQTIIINNFKKKHNEK